MVDGDALASPPPGIDVGALVREVEEDWKRVEDEDGIGVPLLEKGVEEGVAEEGGVDMGEEVGACALAYSTVTVLVVGSGAGGFWARARGAKPRVRSVGRYILFIDYL